MSRWLAKVQVSLKPVVNDPEGSTVARALGQLGFGGVRSVRAGKYFEIVLEAEDQDGATAAVGSMCERLLANPVVEEFRFSLEQLSDPPRPAPGGESRSPG